mmetsp:Transcript_28358/g.69066  ORF Transcript_28358/g.69066 Transcript_28358/m.69066 type:complete len:200 (+) Transcript_28358:1245-1844(+)
MFEDDFFSLLLIAYPFFAFKSAYFLIAFARTCSERLSIAATRFHSWQACSEFTDFRSFPSPSWDDKNSFTLTTSGRASVKVPVLSNTTAVLVPAASNAAPDLYKIPFSAPTPVATMIAVGVASPSEQGHDMTKTATALIKAKRKLLSAPFSVISTGKLTLPAWSTNSQTKKVTRLTPMTVGTKTAAIESAAFWIGGFLL